MPALAALRRALAGWRPDDRRGCLVAYGLLLVWCAPLLIPWDGRGSLISDWEYFLTFFEVFRSTVLDHGQFPALNPYNCLGSPLWANPQIGYVSHYGITVLLFGALGGMKVGMVVSIFFAFEGARALGRRLFRDPTAAVIAGLLYALNPAIAAHLTRGQACFGSYFLAPLLILFCLQLRERRWAGAWAGLCAGAMVLYGVHYFVLYTLALAGLLSAVVAIRGRAGWALLRFGASFVLVLLAVSAARLLPVLSLLAAHPRDVQVALAWPLKLLIKALFVPVVGPEELWHRAGAAGFPIGSWEVSAYVGVSLIPFAVTSLRGGLRFFHVGALLCFALMLGNSAPWHLSRWLGAVPPFDSAWLVFRWRTLFVACMGLAAAAGVDRLASRGKSGESVGILAWVLAPKRIAWLLPLELLIVLWPSWARNVTPTRDVRLTRRDLGIAETSSMVSLRHVLRGKARLLHAATRANLGTRAGYEPIFGYGAIKSARTFLGAASYRGELTLHRQVLGKGGLAKGALSKGEPWPAALWSPNRIVARGLPPGALLELNLTPGRGWSLNGVAIFRREVHFALRARFLVRVPRSGEVDLRYTPPALLAGVWTTSAAAGALLLWFLVDRRRRG